MNSADLLLCLDLGSSGCKGALIDPEGRRILSAREAFAPLSKDGQVGRAEQSPEELWEGVARTIRHLSADARISRVAAICISAQMGSHLLVDSAGCAITNFVSWMDTRANVESVELAHSFSEDQRIQEFGAKLQVVPSWPLPRLKWLRTHDPELLDRARYLIQPKDWIIWKLCGVWISDLSSLRGGRHQISGDVSDSMAKWAGFDPNLLLPVADPSSVAGTILHSVARDLGLPQTTPVMVGWNDLAAATLGATGFPDGAVGIDLTGTSEHLGVTFPQVMCRESLGEGSVIPLTPSQYLNYGVTSSSGRTLRWYWSVFRCKGESAGDYADLESEASKVSAGSNGLICLPCLDGERAPWRNPYTCGTFFGVTPHHQSQHFTRAVLEGVAFTLCSIRNQLDLEIASFRAVGGGAAMSEWNQIKADVLQTAIVTMEDVEAGCRGAAILAAKSLGWYVSIAEAGKSMIRLGRTYEPNKQLSGQYQETHARFEKLYKAVEPLFSRASQRS